jgi:hypothetical protein
MGVIAATPFVEDDVDKLLPGDILYLELVRVG